MQEMWHREEPLTDPRVFQSDIPEWLIVCIQRFTNKDPRKRPQNANDALQLWLQGSSGRLISQEDTSYDPSGLSGEPSQRHISIDNVPNASSHSAFQPNAFQEQSSYVQENMYEDKPAYHSSLRSVQNKKVDNTPSDNEDILFRQHPKFDRVLALLAQRAKEALHTRSQVKIDKYGVC